MILYGHPFSSYSWKAQIALDKARVAHAKAAFDVIYCWLDSRLADDG
jgi:glutathione S-transferase